MSLIFKKENGDTIVEVLIAIAIAGFAIGTSYAIANHSLQQAVTSRERNEAVNLIQSQVAALKIRYTDNQAAFAGVDATYDDPTLGFAVKTTATPNPSSLPYTDFHFCLDEQSAGKDDTTQVWSRINNPFASDSDADNLSSTNKYNKGSLPSNPGCVRNINGTDYFIDISAQVTAGSLNAKNRTVYKLSVRWAQVGSGVNAQSVIYYRF